MAKTPPKLSVFGKSFWKYFYFKIVRQPGTPEFLARGVALGLAVGLIVPIGGQLIIAIPLAIFFKASKILSIIFTMVTNHVTVIFIYPVQCYIGSYLIFSPLSLDSIKSSLKSLLQEQSFEELFELGAHILVSFFAGGIFFAVIFAIPGYFIALYFIRAFRKRRADRIAKKVERD